MNAIGIDIGGMSIYAGLVDEEANIIKSVRYKTSKDREENLKNIIMAIDELMIDKVEGIGIGSPGSIDHKKGRVTQLSGNIENWAYTDIKAHILRYYPDYLIQVENDANVAALCEKWKGSATDLESFVLLTLGTGLGGSVYVNSDFVRGQNFKGAELGHAILFPGGRNCFCGQRGCAEKYVSASAIMTNYYNLTGENIDTKEIFQKSKNDLDAKSAIDKFCHDLAIYLVSLKNIFDPEAFIIAGGILKAHENWWDLMKKYYNEYINISDATQILRAKFLSDAGLIGAAGLILARD